jgi:glycosyltransferase involved in cell wall biosynthesis
VRAILVGLPTQPNSFYRGVRPGQALSAAGHEASVHLADEELLREDDLRGFDVVHLCRYFSRGTQRIAAKLRQAGAAVVWDNDDDLLGFPTTDVESRKRGALRSQGIQARIQEMIRLCDVVTTTSEQLADFYRELGAGCVVVVENYLGREFLDARPRPHDGIVIGWTAAMEHRHDFKALGLREPLQRLIDAHPDVRVTSLGIDLGLDRDRYRWQGCVHFDDLPDVVAEYDIGIAPLVDEAFNRARSNIKLKEYAAFGAPWLASPVGPYRGMGEKQGGRLVADDRWYEELERLVVKARERKKLGKRAQRWARGEAIEANAGRWVAAFEAAIERRGQPAASAATSGTGTSGVRATFSASTSR